MIRGQDPYAPRLRRPIKPPEAALPVDRLRRCGATDRSVDASRDWWDGLDDPARRRAVARLAVLTDADVAKLVATPAWLGRRLKALAE